MSKEDILELFSIYIRMVGIVATILTVGLLIMLILGSTSITFVWFLKAILISFIVPLGMMVVVGLSISMEDL